MRTNTNNLKQKIQTSILPILRICPPSSPINTRTHWRCSECEQRYWETQKHNKQLKNLNTKIKNQFSDKIGSFVNLFHHVASGGGGGDENSALVSNFSYIHSNFIQSLFNFIFHS